MDAIIGVDQAAADFAAATSAKDRSAALARLRSDFAAAASPARRQANLRMRIALLRHWRMAEPLPDAPAEAPVAPPPPQPKGVVKLMALDDAARMLLTAPEPPAPAAARPKMAIDFSIFGDDDETPPDESPDQDSSGAGSKTGASSRSDDEMPSEE